MKVDENGLEVLAPGDCVELLRSRSVGRLGLSARSLPVVLPVSYVIDGDGIVVRTGAATAVASGARDAVVAFEVDEFDDRVGYGWSVLVQGFARELPAPLRLPPHAESVLSRWVDPAASRHFSIPLEVVTGRRLVPVGARPPMPRRP